MALISDVIRILVVWWIARMLMRVFTRPERSSQPKPAPRRAVERTGGTLVRDPHCGTFIPESRAVTLREGDATLHFCSTTCRDAYRAERRDRADGRAQRADLRGEVRGQSHPAADSPGFSAHGGHS